MMSAIGAWLAGIVTKDALSFLWGLIATAWANYQAGQDVAKQAQADANQLQNAKTVGDKNAAANQIDKNTFSGGGGGS